MGTMGNDRLMQNTTMRNIRRVLAVIWLAICGYHFATLAQGVYESEGARFDTLCLNLAFVLLYLAGAFASFFVLLGVTWARIVISGVAILTVIASVTGLLAFFNSHPLSLVGIMFDAFSLLSVGLFLLPDRGSLASVEKQTP
jgi:hypothetical protein